MRCELHFPLAAVALVLMANAASAMAPVFGPRVFTRQAGAPEEVTAAFRSCETDAEFRIVVTNGAPRVTSASIVVNGVEVVGERDLNPNVRELVRPVTLAADNTLTVRLASAPGSSLTIAIECVTGCLAVAITSPGAGATIHGSAIVKGTIQSSDDAGVTVNGVAAVIDGAQFTALVPVADGIDALEAIATNTCGHTATASLAIRGEDAPAELPSGISASPRMGLVPLQVRLSVSPAFANPIANVMWDFDGNGTIDAAGAALFETDATYAGAGIFTPTVTIRDAGGAQASASAVVIAYDLASLTARLNARWSSFVSALENGRLDVALSLIDSTRRAQSEQRLRGVDLAALAAQLDAPLQLRDVRGPRAFGTAGTLPVVLRLDDDGDWRIRFF